MEWPEITVSKTVFIYFYNSTQVLVQSKNKYSRIHSKITARADKGDIFI